MITLKGGKTADSELAIYTPALLLNQCYVENGRLPLATTHDKRVCVYVNHLMTPLTIPPDFPRAVQASRSFLTVKRNTGRLQRRQQQRRQRQKQRHGNNNKQASTYATEYDVFCFFFAFPGHDRKCLSTTWLRRNRWRLYGKQCNLTQPNLGIYRCQKPCR